MIVYDRTGVPEWMRFHAVLTAKERVYLLAALQAMYEELKKIPKKTAQDEQHIKQYRAMIRQWKRPTLSTRETRKGI